MTKNILVNAFLLLTKKQINYIVYCIFEKTNFLRTSVIYKDIPPQFKEKLLLWSQKFREIIFLDSNNYPQKYSNYDCVLAVDAFTSIQTDFVNGFEDLKKYQQTTKDWLFGYLAYDLKNDTEALNSDNFDGLKFPDLFFFQPKKIFLLRDATLEIQYLNVCEDEMTFDLEEINSQVLKNDISFSEIKISQRISQQEYIEKITKMLQAINRGDIYEANFCMEFFATDSIIDPLQKFNKLNAISKPPFAVFFKNNKHFLLSASPERYLKRTGNSVISQPIKGTSKRFENPIEDQKSRIDLALDPKERAENIMITDLVRNDLSKTAQKGSVIVEELCQVYSFMQVHQMISSVTSSLDNKYSALDLIKTTFPMGSMTGAPKIAAMQIIEALEETKRGLYSGTIGYFNPEGDFDFNVVIRSILYNEQNKYVSFSVGSAITSESIPEKEYQECLLKAQAMIIVLS